MIAKALQKVILITENEDLCSCNVDFYSECEVRKFGNLPCQKSIVRIYACEDHKFVPDVSPEIEKLRSLHEDLNDTEHNFSSTLKHLEEFKGL